VTVTIHASFTTPVVLYTLQNKCKSM